MTGEFFVKGKWVIDGNHIALQTGDKIEQFDALFFYDVLSGERCLTEVDSSEVDILCYTIAKIGLPLKIELTLINQNSSIGITLFVIKQNKKIPVDIRNKRIVNHGVCAQTWFYIIGPLDDVNNALQLAKIVDSGRINLNQYLRLLTECKNRSIDLIEDNVDISLLDDALSISNIQPPLLFASLYPYQKTGYAWLKYMASEECGCILGDEMGLGKTLQVISLMTDYVSSGDIPMLVIAPVSLLENWRREIIKFAPYIRPFIHHGSMRTGRYLELLKFDVVLISYNTAVSDLSMLRMIPWSLVCLDEAQYIKNPSSERAKSVKMIPRKMSVAISGTPFENHITDIWSIMDFVFPDYLGTLSSFSNTVSDDILGAKTVEPLITPLMLRRLVKDVADELPERVIIPQAIIMSDWEGSEYENIRVDSMPPGSFNLNLGALQKMRMFCTHPQIINEKILGDPMQISVKYERLCEILDEIVARNEKALIFTSYKKMFEIFMNDLPVKFGVQVLAINGETPVVRRQEIVDIFSNIDGPAIFILNPRAAGTGLNITAANHVIHYNLEWNPALEDQSSARAYRRGQHKTVFVHRLFYVNTVEQIVNERIERKREISEAAIVGTIGEDTSREDIARALLLSPLC